MQGSTIAKQADAIAYGVSARFADVSFDIVESDCYAVLVSMLERKITDVPTAIAARLENKLNIPFEESLGIVTHALGNFQCSQ